MANDFINQACVLQRPHTQKGGVQRAAGIWGEWRPEGMEAAGPFRIPSVTS